MSLDQTQLILNLPIRRYLVTGHRDVTTRRYSVAEAKKSLSKLIREAEQGKDVYIH